MDNLGNKLKELRKLSGMTQREISIKLGITERNYQRYESDKGIPKLSNLIALADLFNVSLDFLMGRKGNFNDTLYKEESDLL